MASRSQAVRAAWITGILGIVGVVAAGVLSLMQGSQVTAPAVTATSPGDGSTVIAIGGSVKDSQITVKPPKGSQRGQA